MAANMLLLNPRRKTRRVSRKSRKPRARRSVKRVRRNVRAKRGDIITLKTNPRRRSRRTVRATRRRAGRRGSRRAAGGFMGTVRELAAPDTLMLAGGAMGAGLVTSFVTSKWGDKLPGASSKAGSIGYAVGIPTLLAVLVNRWQPRVAQGLLIGAVVQGVSAAIGDALNAAVTGTATAGGVGEYVNASLPPGRPSMGGIGFDGINAFGVQPGGDDRSLLQAYKTTPWS